MQLLCYGPNGKVYPLSHLNTQVVKIVPAVCLGLHHFALQICDFKMAKMVESTFRKDIGRGDEAEWLLLQAKRLLK